MVVRYMQLLESEEFDSSSFVPDLDFCRMERTLDYCYCWLLTVLRTWLEQLDLKSGFNRFIPIRQHGSCWAVSMSRILPSVLLSALATTWRSGLFIGALSGVNCFYLLWLLRFFHITPVSRSTTVLFPFFGELFWRNLARTFICASFIRHIMSLQVSFTNRPLHNERCALLPL